MLQSLTVAQYTPRSNRLGNPHLTRELSIESIIWYLHPSTCDAFRRRPRRPAGLNGCILHRRLSSSVHFGAESLGVSVSDAIIYAVTPLATHYTGDCMYYNRHQLLACLSFVDAAAVAAQKESIRRDRTGLANTQLNRRLGGSICSSIGESEL